LQDNEILILAADGVGLRDLMDDSFRPYPFLGKTMLFPTNYVSLARRTGAALIPVFAVREGARQRIVFHPPLTGMTTLASWNSTSRFWSRMYGSILTCGSSGRSSLKANC